MLATLLVILLKMSFLQSFVTLALKEDEQTLTAAFFYATIHLK